MDDARVGGLVRSWPIGTVALVMPSQEPNEHAQPAWWLPPGDMKYAERHLPIACTDVVLVKSGTAETKFGLIRRKTPFGNLRWCHIGGRVRYGESAREAIVRHLEVLSDLDDIPFINVL